MIKFGTDGWRALIAEDFTFENVQIVSQAFADYIGKTSHPVIIGYDNRFLSEEFALTAAKVVASNGIRVLLSDSSCPTPAVSFHVKEGSAAAGIMITASHNPPEWNGFKVKGAYGGSATIEITKGIEKKLSPGRPVSLKEGIDIEKFDPKKGYLEKLRSFVDMAKISSVNSPILINPMFGSGSGYFTELLKGTLNIREINSHRDTYFGGVNPEPIPVNLKSFMSLCAKEKAFGIVLDGDADRIGAVSSDGTYINTHQIFALLLYHLVKNKKMSGAVVKTFNMSRLIDMMTNRYSLKLHETPIGFKHICDLMIKEDILIGGEESGGMGIKDHLPERDGLLAGLLLIELMAFEGKSIEAILDDISTQFARFYYDRIDVHINNEQKEAINKQLSGNPLKELAGYRIKELKTLDGYKFIFENGDWILFRPSGTEPLLRIYCEADSQDKVTKLLAEGRKLLNI